MKAAGYGNGGALAATAGGSARRMEKWRQRAPAIVAATGLLLLWQLIVDGFGVPTYIAPSPLQIVGVFAEEGHILWNNFWPTLLEAAAGFALGNTIAVALAVWFRAQPARRTGLLSDRGLRQHDPDHCHRAHLGADAGQRL